MADDTSGSGRRPFIGRGDDPRARAVDDGGVAPVIPLFGGSSSAVGAHPSRGRRPVAGLDDADPREGAASAGARAVGRPLSNDDGHLVAGSRRRPDGGPAAARSPFDRSAPGRPVEGEGDGARSARGRLTRIDGFSSPDAGAERAEPDAAEVRGRAEEVLLRKLRARSLSLTEARAALRAVDDVDDAIVSDVIDHFVDLGYLDDASLAEQLAMSATERRGQGRRAVAETLRKRGVSREVADAAIAEMPDDDAERALEFARSKMRSVGGKDYDTDLRRLAGQLARRGYPSSVALTAARTALDEAGRGRTRSPFRPTSSSSVRFTPDD